MKYKVTHTTTYRYGESVAISQNIAHLMPRDTGRQTCHGCDLVVTPEPAVIRERRDFFGNRLSYFAVQEPHSRLTVTALGDVEVLPFTLPEPFASPAWEEARQILRTDRTRQSLVACEFIFDSPYVKRSSELADYANASFTPGRPLFDAARDLCRRIHADFTFDAFANSSMSTPLPDLLSVRRGVCQDFAHLQIGCMRSLGLSARYVSGYILTRPPPGRPRLAGADASHAWLSVYVPGYGWIDLDPTNDRVVSEQHVTVAWGRDYGDVSPLQGVILGGRRHTMSVAVDVVPAGELAGAATPEPAAQG